MVLIISLWLQQLAVILKHVQLENLVSINFVHLLLDLHGLEEILEHSLVSLNMLCVILDSFTFQKLQMHVLNYCVMIGSYWVVFLKVLLNGHGLLEETQVSEGKIVSNKAQATVDDFRD